MGLTLVALLLAAPRAGAVPSSGDEAAIRALYKAFDEGFEKQELDAIEPLFAHDYAATLVDGSTNGRDETIAEIREEATSAIAPVHCKAQLKRIAIAGDHATVQVAEETGYQVRSPDGKLHAYRYTESYEDQLAKTEEGWRFQSTRFDADGVELLDGKPIPHGELKNVLAAAAGRDPALAALYARADAAFEKHDLDGLAALHTETWLVRSTEGETPHAVAIASLRREAEAAQPPVHRHTELGKVVVEGSAATARLICETSYTVRAADGKSHLLRYSQPLEDQLVLGPDGWRVQSTRLLDGGEAAFDGRTSTRDEIDRLLGR